MSCHATSGPLKSPREEYIPLSCRPWQALSAGAYDAWFDAAALSSSIAARRTAQEACRQYGCRQRPRTEWYPDRRQLFCHANERLLSRLSGATLRALREVV